MIGRYGHIRALSILSIAGVLGMATPAFAGVATPTQQSNTTPIVASAAAQQATPFHLASSRTSTVEMGGFSFEVPSGFICFDSDESSGGWVSLADSDIFFTVHTFTIDRSVTAEDYLAFYIESYDCITLSDMEVGASSSRSYAMQVCLDEDLDEVVFFVEMNGNDAIFIFYYFDLYDVDFEPFGDLMLSVSPISKSSSSTGLGASTSPRTDVDTDTDKADDADSDAGKAEAGAYADGTYTAEGKGIGGKVPVTVEIKDGKIASVEVGDNSETAGIGSKAIEQLPAEIVAANGTEGVDGVSGATITSKAIFTAVDDCLAQASAA